MCRSFCICLTRHTQNNEGTWPSYGWGHGPAWAEDGDVVWLFLYSALLSPTHTHRTKWGPGCLPLPCLPASRCVFLSISPLTHDTHTEPGVGEPHSPPTRGRGGGGGGGGSPPRRPPCPRVFPLLFLECPHTDHTHTGNQLGGGPGGRPPWMGGPRQLATHRLGDTRASPRPQ